MNNNLQFYQDIIPIDRTLHQQWALSPLPNAEFSRSAHAVLLLGSEFVEASHEYPIVFVRNGEQVMPIALLGLRDGENLFVDAQGKWDARYIPAYVRRYPFTFTEVPGGHALLSIDKACLGLDKTGQIGQRLFDQEGKETDLLKNMLVFTQSYQEDYLRTRQLCTELDKLGLFKDMNMMATLPNGERFNMNGFLVVDEQKLLGLEQADITSLFRSGALGSIYAHLISMGNATHLMNKLAVRNAVSISATLP